jgi:hypothetical protein
VPKQITPKPHVYAPIDDVKWGPQNKPNLGGMNPGYIINAVQPNYEGTATQATNYWGYHPYVSDLAHLSDYTKVPAGQAWGAQYAQGVGPNKLDINQFSQEMLGNFKSAGPLVPLTKKA